MFAESVMLLKYPASSPSWQLCLGLLTKKTEVHICVARGTQMDILAGCLVGQTEARIGRLENDDLEDAHKWSRR